MNLTDLLIQQDDGAAVDTLARQFNISHGQAAEAIELLMPAFSEGLKRNASLPGGTEQFIDALARGNHQRYMEDPELAASQAGVSEGNAILGHVFGNKDVSRAVASHAASSSGPTTISMKV